MWKALFMTPETIAYLLVLAGVFLVMRWLWRKGSNRRRCQSTDLSGRQCREAAVTSGKPAFCAEHKHLA
jgi:hypothetical protein